MERKGRKDLKDIFSRGSLPTETHFQALIDSVLNLEDDEFQSLLDGPLKVYVKNDKDLSSERRIVLEFYKDVESTISRPVWKIALDASEPGNESLKLINEQNEETLSISQNGQMILNTKSIHHKGTTYASELYGNHQGFNANNCVQADGNWHALISELSGCQVYDVIACVGNKYSLDKYYGITRATASLIPSKKRVWDFLFPEKNKIHMMQNYSGSSQNKIDMRWRRIGDLFQLEARTRREFKGNAMINYRILKIFSDEFMDDNQPQP